jgi:hypothetical protein
MKESMHAPQRGTRQWDIEVECLISRIRDWKMNPHQDCECKRRVVESLEVVGLLGLSRSLGFVRRDVRGEPQQKEVHQEK